jgi:hypothetical protein
MAETRPEKFQLLVDAVCCGPRLRSVSVTLWQWRLSRLARVGSEQDERKREKGKERDGMQENTAGKSECENILVDKRKRRR